MAEAFDPSQAHIDARTKRFEIGGIKLALLPKKTRGETVTAFLSLRFGTEQSLANRSAAATLTSQMLMRGTKSLTRQQLRDSLDRLKARVQVTSPGAGVVRVAVETARPNLPAALRLVGEMARQPAFDAKELDELQRETISAVEAQRSEPTVMGQTLFAKQVLRYPKGHPRYVASADEQVEALKAATLADVKKFHADFYGASHGELVIIGDFDDAAVMKAVSEQFGTWKSAKPFKPVPTVLAAATPGRQQVEAPDKPNAFFLAGQTFPMKDTDPDYPAMLLANAILGESALDSRLPARIRVKEGLSYIVQSVISANSIDRAAQWMALAVYAPQNADKVTAAFTDEMNTILQSGFSAEEVEKAKGAYLQRRKLARGNDSQLSQQLSTALYLGRTMGFDEALEAKIAALTPEQVNAAVRRVLDPSKMAIVLVGDFAKAKLAATPKN